METLQEICERYDLALLTSMDGCSSEFVAKVRLPDERLAVLKSPARDDDREASLLEHWHDVPHTPRVIRRLPDGRYLREWVDGITLDELGDDIITHASAVGELLKRLHAVPFNEDDWSSMWPWIYAQEEYLQQSTRIRDEHKEAITLLYDRLRVPTTPNVLLHGDAYYRNILWDNGHMAIIDPRGQTGPPSFDLACFASLSNVAYPEEVLENAINGYDGDLPLAWQLFLMLTLRSIERFHGNHGLSQNTPDWQALADRLIQQEVWKR